MENEIKSKLVPGIGRVPFPAYRGQGRYIFVSYAHADKELVFPEIIRFQEMGYNIWYDEEITPGNEWKHHITDRLMHCDLFIIFITNRSANSKNCRKEFYCALNNNKHVIPFYLEDFDTVEIDDEWKGDLSEIQGILMTTYDDEEAYIFKFTEAFRNFGFEIFNFSKGFLEKTLYESKMNPNMKLNNIRRGFEDFFDKIYVCKNSKKAPYAAIFKSSIDLFIDHPGTYLADEIYSNFISLYEMIMKLGSEEHSINANKIRQFYKTLKRNDESQPRENFIHSANVFILGLAIYSQNEKFRMVFEDYLQDYGIKYCESQIHEEFLIRWGIASLFHDSCFAIEASEKKVKNSIFKELKQFLEYDEDCLMGGVNEFNILSKPYAKRKTIADEIPNHILENIDIDMEKPTDILAAKIARDLRLDSKGLNKLKNNLTFFLNYSYDNDFDEHGILSSIMVLNCFSGLDSDGQFLPENHLHYTILDSASAILLHNYYHYILQEDPFDFDRLMLCEIPLAYLLILCDEITETSVDSIDFKISDEFYAKYHLESSSRGFGFHDKEQLLEHILDLKNLFYGNIRIVKDINPNAFFEIKKRNFEEKYIEPPILMVERIAREIHDRYAETVIASYESNPADEHLKSRYESLTSFDELSMQLQRANINIAKGIYRKLYFQRYAIVNVADPREGIDQFLEWEITELAKMEHAEWCDEKIATGWTYGPLKDVKNLTTPYLVPWDRLDPEIRAYDIDPIKEIPQILSRMDLKVVKSKLNLLTREMYKHVCKFIGVESEFESLKPHLQELHYQKTDLIAEALFEINYKIVDEDAPGDAISELSKREIAYVETNVHREYLKTQINLGLDVRNYLEDRIDVEKRRYAQRLNEVSIRDLPELCRNVGLKITKTD